MPESYTASALRHFADADRLAAHAQLGGAGYLIGFAVECAIKSAISATRPAAEAPHVHLPQLVERAKKTLQGRRTASIFKVLEQADFMRGWTIDLRYEADGAVAEDQFVRWRVNSDNHDGRSTTIMLAGGAGRRRA